jgi:hypothetical protein
MDNSTSKSIMETINDSIKSNNFASNSNVVNVANTPSSTSENGWFGSLFSVPITTWIIIIIIFTFIGFNVFFYLAKGTQEFTNFFNPIISKIVGLFTTITGQVINTTATGAKEVINKSTDVVDSGLTSIQNSSGGKYSQDNNHAQGNKAVSSIKGTTISEAISESDIMQNNTLNKALNKKNVQQNIGQTHDYIADDSTSKIQKAQSKGGYCYIGEERGHRSCMRVTENDTCMSGEIFPTSEICINPNLRV